MAEIVHALKIRARILHNQIASGRPDAVKKSHTIKELAKLDEETIAATIKRRHCLAIVAKECGFNGWPHLTAVILHNDLAMGLGTLLHPKRCGVHWNIWFADYTETKRVREEHGGYLLGYKNQFLIVDEDYINTLGFDANDPDLLRAGRDWIKPESSAARLNLFTRLIQIIHNKNPIQQPEKLSA